MDPFNFPDNCFGFRLELVDEFTDIPKSILNFFLGGGVENTTLKAYEINKLRLQIL